LDDTRQIENLDFGTIVLDLTRHGGELQQGQSELRR
jgi:hypothetical protein